MSDDYEIKGKYDEADMLMKLHNISMESRDPIESTAARMLKVMMPVVINMINDEIESSHDSSSRSDLILASVLASRSMLTNMLINILPPEAIAPQFDMLADLFSQMLKVDGRELIKEYGDNYDHA